MLRFAVLGPLLAWRDAEPVDIGHVKQQALLAALLLRPDVTVSRQELLAGVWGTEPPVTGRDLVANYVHRLRSVSSRRSSPPSRPDIASPAGRPGWIPRT